MGVLNVTPDSFSDGGRYPDVEAAVAHGRQMSADGADLVDVGGESTRPGAPRVAADEERRRVLPVVRELAGAGVAVSIDTTRAAVAEAALVAGATVVNDVSGGLADPAMAGVVAAAGAPWVLMHWRGHSRDMRERASYDDVVADVTRELSQRVDDAVSAGVPVESLVIDPGLGFAKTAEHNWALLAHLDRLLALGPPVLIGASRKSFLGPLLADAQGTPRPVEDRDNASLATSVIAALAGVWGVRVHDVRPTVDALAVVAATVAARSGPFRGGTAPGGGTAARRHRGRRRHDD
jgi:dihydropteroate synthase